MTLGVICVVAAIVALAVLDSYWVDGRGAASDAGCGLASGRGWLTSASSGRCCCGI